MTFLGKPRTPLAEHAHESNWFMTIPLVLLSVFAIGAGWFGIPEDFPVLGPIINNNWVHHFVGATVEHTLEELHELGYVGHALETLQFNPIPLLASVVVALGGIFVGWWIYGRNPLREEEKDPLINTLGPLHNFLQNKWYWDELYQTLFIAPTVRFSEYFVYEVVDKGIIDGILHLVARSVYRVGQMMKSFENAVFGRGVDWVKDQVLNTAREFRQLQTGKVQEYTLVSMLIASALALVVLALNYGWLTPLLEMF
jgi:NADH-quinone oxidoreductase subunit L